VFGVFSEPQKEHLVLTESETQPKQEEQKTTSSIHNFHVPVLFL
jgi:hypothetical protein